MQKLLSLPPNLVDCFHEIEGADHKDWFCTSDPIGAKLGSGGGTTWLLSECQKANAPESSFNEWLSQEKRILLHVEFILNTLFDTCYRQRNLSCYESFPTTFTFMRAGYRSTPSTG